jgi:hypothetical protein
VHAIPSQSYSFAEDNLEKRRIKKQDTILGIQHLDQPLPEPEPPGTGGKEISVPLFPKERLPQSSVLIATCYLVSKKRTCLAPLASITRSLPCGICTCIGLQSHPKTFNVKIWGQGELLRGIG